MNACETRQRQGVAAAGADLERASERLNAQQHTTVSCESAHYASLRRGRFIVRQARYLRLIAVRSRQVSLWLPGPRPATVTHVGGGFMDFAHTRQRTCATAASRHARCRHTRPARPVRSSATPFVFFTFYNLTALTRPKKRQAQTTTNKSI